MGCCILLLNILFILMVIAIQSLMLLTPSIALLSALMFFLNLAMDRIEEIGLRRREEIRK